MNKFPSLYILLLIFSGVSLLAVERGNNDLLAFVLLFAGISLSQVYFRSFSILLAAVLKIYPVFLIFALLKKPKILIPFILIIACYFIYGFNELKIIQAGNTVLSLYPASVMATYGFETNIQIFSHVIIPGQSTAVYTLIKYILIFVSLILALFISRVKYLDLSGNSPYKTDLFLLGGIIFFGSYLITSNWDYRLIFLIACIPYILSIKNGFIKHSFPAGILFASNSSTIVEFLGTPGIILCAIIKYFIFIMVTAYLAREIVGYLSPLLRNSPFNRPIEKAKQ